MIIFLWLPVPFCGFGQVVYEKQYDFDFPCPDKAYGWNWLYTGSWGAGSQTNIGLDGAGTWYAGILLNLSAHIGDSITKIGYYHGDSATVTAKIYTGDYQTPLVLVGQSNSYTFTTPGWKQNILLLSPVPINSPALYWIVLEVLDPGANYYPIGTRAPLNQNAGKISLNGTTWTDLSDYSLNYSWLLGAYVYCVCPPPKNLNSTWAGPNSANISWVTQGGTVSQWQIQYGQSGFTPGSGQTVSSATTSTTLFNLNHSTQYQFYVRAVCSQGDTSFWAGPGSFETEFINYQAEILSYYFGFPGEIDNINEPDISVSIPSNPDLSSLVAHFTVSPGVREVKVSGVEQISGQTANNFYSPVIYSVMAEDSITIKNWVVIVNDYNDIDDSEKSGVIVYPNPCSVYFDIITDKFNEIELFDNHGTMIYHHENVEHSLRIETVNYPKGFFILKIRDEESVIFKKVIIR